MLWLYSQMCDTSLFTFSSYLELVCPPFGRLFWRYLPSAHAQLKSSITSASHGNCEAINCSTWQGSDGCSSFGRVLRQLLFIFFILNGVESEIWPRIVIIGSVPLVWNSSTPCTSCTCPSIYSPILRILTNRLVEQHLPWILDLILSSIHDDFSSVRLNGVHLLQSAFIFYTVLLFSHD